MEMVTSIFFFALNMYVAQTMYTSFQEKNHTGSEMGPEVIRDEKILSLLYHYATDSLQLTERVKGNDGLLVLQDSAQNHGDNTHGSELSKSRNGQWSADMEESTKDGSASASGIGQLDEVSSGSGENSGDNDLLSESEMDAELQRMTTVVYDCNSRTETVGDWRNEIRVSVGHSNSHTNDSMLRSSEKKSESEPKERPARFIFGEDNREFVTNSSSFPQCAIARVTTGCTAFFIGPYHALTAAHCVNNFRYGWRGRIRMWRERNCHDRGFHSTCSRVFAVMGHTHNKLYEYDYALVELDRSGDPAPCWFGIGYINPWDSPSSMNLEVLGYPADKRRYTGQPECSYEAMWLARCDVSYGLHQNLLQWCDALSGNSGSPVFSETNQNKVVYGIHAQSVGNYVISEDGRQELEHLWNQGPMITPLRYFQILRWMELS